MTNPKALSKVRVYMQSRSGAVGLSIVAAFIIVAAVAPVIGIQDPEKINPSIRLMGPNQDHWLGTDHYGRDLLARLVYGTRSSLLVAFVSILLATIIGLSLGLIAGYFGRFVSQLIMRFIDVVMAFPAILLGMALIAAVGPSLFNIIIVITIVQLPTIVRVVRGDTIVVKEKEFIEASRSTGAFSIYTITKHILPNVLPSLIVIGTVGLAQAVILEAAFGFLGLGVQPPTPSWGNLLADGREYMRSSPHTSIFPGLFVVVLALSFNLLGEGLRVYIDPRARSKRAK